MMLRRIEGPAWASPLEVSRAQDFDDADYAALQTVRADIDRAVDLAVQKFVAELATDNLFPQLDRLTGEFYLGSENYWIVDEPWLAKAGRQREISFSFCVRCLEFPSQPAQIDCDYLGLEIHFHYDGDGRFHWVATDSSSI